jgi:hypothetical protein
MANWNEILGELQANNKSPFDHLRLKYLKGVSKHTGRNTLAYYSGWLQKPQLQNSQHINFGIDDADLTGFMTCSHNMKREKGLDLILHTPGGDVAATESLINYLHSLYDGNIRAIIPQLAMSGGTLMAVSCRQIIMGRQSSIGPVDPQINGMPAQGLLEEFANARNEILNNPNAIGLWEPILGKFWPTLITSCQHWVDWSDSLLRKVLSDCMLKDDPLKDEKVEQIADLLGKQSTSKSHNRHITCQQAADLGLNVVKLEDDQKLQDAVLSLHHTYTHTFSNTAAVKIIENHDGMTYVSGAAAVPA